MFSLFEILIYSHAAFGGIALLTGGIALVSAKGKTIHKKSGKVFYFTMLLSALLALVISVMPDHKNPFLFSIGVFSSYFLLSGLRSLQYKNTSLDLKWDNLLAILIIITGISMISLPAAIYGEINIVLLVFGILGLTFGIRDLKMFREPEILKRNWLKMHLGKMMGGYIAAVSAFFVVNQILPGVWNWFVPGIIGGAYITFWMQRLKSSI